MRRPPASMLGDAADGAEAPPTLQASGGAPPPLAGAKKSLGDPVGPSKFVSLASVTYCSPVEDYGWFRSCLYSQILAARHLQSTVPLIERILKLCWSSIKRKSGERWKRQQISFTEHWGR
jgi:hypothetical protein